MYLCTDQGDGPFPATPTINHISISLLYSISVTKGLKPYKMDSTKALDISKTVLHGLVYMHAPRQIRLQKRDSP